MNVLRTFYGLQAKMPWSLGSRPNSGVSKGQQRALLAPGKFQYHHIANTGAGFQNCQHIVSHVAQVAHHAHGDVFIGQQFHAARAWAKYCSSCRQSALKANTACRAVMFSVG